MQKLRFPVDFVGITNGYSKEHQAIDLGWHKTQHEGIYACADGKVVNIWEDTQFGGGLSLKIEYDNGFSSDFKHLAETLVKIGERVVQGQQVAIMGNSGWASVGTHLHYNCYKKGARVNPLEYTYLYPGQKVSDDDKNKVLVYVEKPVNPTKFEIGDKVIVNDDLYLTANSETPNGHATDEETIITRIAENAKHPYNTTGDLGWMDEESIKLINKEKIYIVKEGDNLSSIAKKYNTTWQKIYEDNKSVIGDNPNLILPNTKLIIK